VESNLTPSGFLLSHKKASGADGVTPPGFLPPVKGQVASLSYIGGLHKPTFFSIITTIAKKLIKNACK